MQDDMMLIRVKVMYCNFFRRVHVQEINRR